MFIYLILIEIDVILEHILMDGCLKSETINLEIDKFFRYANGGSVIRSTG